MAELFTKNEYDAIHFEDIAADGQALCEKEFEGCSFERCHFSEAVWQRCRFIDCCFSHCNLSLLQLHYSTLSNVRFDECKVIGIDWTKAVWSKLASRSPLSFNQCLLSNTSFFQLHLKGLILTKCRAHDVDFRGGDFSGSNFSDTDFSRSLFSKTNLTNTNFSGAVHYDIDLFDNTLTGAQFSRWEAIHLLDCLDIVFTD